MPCKKHPNYSKWHPTEICSVCYWEKVKKIMISDHPDWSEKQIELALDNKVSRNTL